MTVKGNNAPGLQDEPPCAELASVHADFRTKINRCKHGVRDARRRGRSASERIGADVAGRAFASKGWRGETAQSGRGQCGNKSFRHKMSFVQS